MTLSHKWEKNDSGSWAQGSKWRKKWVYVINEQNDSRSWVPGSKWKRTECGSQIRKTTMGRELRALNRKEITRGHKWDKTTLGHELRALKGKEMTLGHKWEKMTLGRELEALNGKKWFFVINGQNNSGSWASSSKWKRNYSGIEMRKTSLRHEPRALNGKEMTMGYKWETQLMVVSSRL